MEIVKNRLSHYDMASADVDILDESLVVIVPDTEPDILQIIAAGPLLYVQEKSCQEGLVKAAGSVNCCISYISTEGHTPHRINAAVPFSFSRELGNMGEEDRAEVTVKVLSASASMINPRKVSVKIQVEVFRRVYHKCVQEYAERLISGDDDGVCSRGDTVDVSLLTDVVSKRIVVGDEIRLDGERLDSSCVIIRADTLWEIEDTKIMANKVMVRGHVESRIAAVCGDGSLSCRNRYTIPFSQMIEIDGITPDDEAELEYRPLRDEIEITSSSDGGDVMRFTFTAEAQCRMRRQMKISAVRDAYSMKWESSCAETWLLEGGCRSAALTLPVKETVPLDAGIEKVIDIFVTPADAVIKEKERETGIGFYFTFIGQQADGAPAVCTRRIYAGGEAEAPIGSGGWCSGECLHPEWELNGEEASVSFEARISRYESSRRASCVISDMTVDREKARTGGSRASVIVRSADKSDSIWNIAKAYGTYPRVIAAANRMAEDEEIAAGRLILIPFAQR